MEIINKTTNYKCSRKPDCKSRIYFFCKRFKSFCLFKFVKTFRCFSNSNTLVVYISSIFGFRLCNCWNKICNNYCSTSSIHWCMWNMDTINDNFILSTCVCSAVFCYRSSSWNNCILQ